jgi:possible RNA-binding protein
MEVYEFKGINKEEALKKAENELCIDREALIIEEEIETKEINKTMFSILDRDKVTLKISVNEDKKEKNRFDVEKVKDTKTRLDNFFKVLSGIYEDINFKYDIKVQGRKIYINITSDQNPKWIGRDGHTLEELQSFLKNIVRAKSNIRIYLDVAGYKERRERKLIKIAEYGLSRVMKHGVPFSLEPMNSYERRLIHAYLQKENVKTKSEGKEPNRYIVITPKNSEE